MFIIISPEINLFYACMKQFFVFKLSIFITSENLNYVGVNVYLNSTYHIWCSQFDIINLKTNNIVSCKIDCIGFCKITV